MVSGAISRSLPPRCSSSCKLHIHIYTKRTASETCAWFAILLNSCLAVIWQKLISLLAYLRPGLPSTHRLNQHHISRKLQRSSRIQPHLHFIQRTSDLKSIVLPFYHRFKALLAEGMPAHGKQPGRVVILVLFFASRADQFLHFVILLFLANSNITSIWITINRHHLFILNFYEAI